jgi:hypothetical protein
MRVSVSLRIAAALVATSVTAHALDASFRQLLAPSGPGWQHIFRHHDAAMLVIEMRR